ncbi:uncharacterized protein RJT20DRAFT_132926 [Scheffersomyces xylosifermentans]|uniref:uncharacterized protein n=1 Tax=Scheffersomyces xylosifermentans TaxID=1304137 RepID=UPI00315DE42A
MSRLLAQLCDQTDFGSISFRPPLLFKPDIVHLWKANVSPGFQRPLYCLGIGNFKKSNYRMDDGFKGLMAYLGTRPSLQVNGRMFEDNDWNSTICFTKVLRKYLYQAFVTGTNRILLSDVNNFSAFLEYEFNKERKLVIRYYVVSDPESIEEGFTLRSLIAGFFNNSFDGAKRIFDALEVTSNGAVLLNGSIDILDNVGPSATNSKKSSSSSPPRKRWPPTILEDQGEWGDNIHDNPGNTYCRVEYDAAKSFPQFELPSTVFVKIYYYDKEWLMDGHSFGLDDEGRDTEQYYDMFFNELDINEKIGASEFAHNYPKILASGLVERTSGPSYTHL